MAAHRHCRPVIVNKDGDAIQATLPDRLAALYLSMDGERDLPVLDGVATAPLLQADGTILDREGYDPQSRMWCCRVPKLDVPQHPTREDAAHALSELRLAFRTFAFADAETLVDPTLGLSVIDLDKPPATDESSMLCGLLTAIVRASLDLAPGLLITASAVSGAGTGKGLLVRAICEIAHGVRPRAFTAGSDRQELDKRVAAELVGAAPALFLDNVNNTSLRSDQLASVLTERPARVRLLGKTEMVDLNTTAFVAVAGNGLRVSEDLSRRFIECRLDAGTENPESRPFPGGFLKSIGQARPGLLTAALTIWRWGRQNAETLSAGQALGSYEEWASWVRDPLLALGCTDPVVRMAAAKADDPARQRLVELFVAWDAKHGNAPVAAAELHESVRLVADPQGHGRQWLASYLNRLTGTRLAGFVLTAERLGQWSATTYALQRATEGHREHRGHRDREAQLVPPMAPMSPMASVPCSEGLRDEPY
jgi:hypothetical protein